MINENEIAKQFSNVINCRSCELLCDKKILIDDSFNLPQPGYIGDGYKESRVLLIGQNPGVSTDTQHENDLVYSKALSKLKDPSVESLKELQFELKRIIPTWPVTGNYFPLSDSNLSIEDIAYLNIVRCRTEGNSTPSNKVTQMCVQTHAEKWLEFLKPEIVICIGKWAHDKICAKLDELKIPHTYMNRMRSLSTEERMKNREEVVSLVKNKVFTKCKATPSIKPKAKKAIINKTIKPINKITLKDSTMNSEAYIEMFTKLGFINIVTGNTLKHRKPLPKIYFNYRKRDSFASFVIYFDQINQFSESLWKIIPAQKGKDDKAYLRTVIPVNGKELEAFKSLLRESSNG